MRRRIPRMRCGTVESVSPTHTGFTDYYEDPILSNEKPRMFLPRTSANTDVGYGFRPGRCPSAFGHASLLSELVAARIADLLAFGAKLSAHLRS